MRWVGDNIEFCNMNRNEKVALQSLVSSLPDDPLVVEIGTFTGGSIALMHRMRPDARFIVIDGWINHGTAEMVDGTVDDWGNLDGKNPRDLFLENTKGIDIELHDLFVRDPDDLRGMFDHVKCDLYFDDASAVALPYWIDRVKTGGIVCGHDYYSQEWIDDAFDRDEYHRRLNSINVDRLVVDEVAAKHGVEVNVSSTFWWFRKHW